MRLVTAVIAMGERATLLECLSATQNRADKAEADIKLQKEIIATGKATDGGVDAAVKHLRSLELDLQTHLAEAERILDALDALPLLEDELRA